MTTHDLYRHQVDAEHYDQLLQQKARMLQQHFSSFDVPELTVFPSRPSHFRLRAEFRIWHEQERCFYTMSEPGDKHKRYEVIDFPIASELINTLMKQLIEEIAQQQVLRHRLFQVEFLTTLSGDALITLIYHKPLDENWQQHAKELQKNTGFPIIGRSRKQKIVLERDFVTENLNVDGNTLSYRQIEGGFTQPNGGINQKMLSWARSVSKNFEGDLVEFYCGNGNFSIALADQYRKVLATEISKTSVQAAQENIRANRIQNLIIARLSSEEFVQALRGDREFKRLKGIDLGSYDFQTVLVDPPRAGLDPESVRQIQNYRNIIYISCNPETLHHNLIELTKTHRIQHFALFDQFPYTRHTETGVVLTKRDS